jgi:signal transduction histidine kinase
VRTTLHALAESPDSSQDHAFEFAPQATQAREEQILRGLARALGKLAGAATALALVPGENDQLRLLGIRSGERTLSAEESHQLVAAITAGVGNALELTPTDPLWPALAAGLPPARGRERAEPAHTLVLPVHAGTSLVGAVVLFSRQALRAEAWQPLARTLCAATGERIHADRAEAGAEARASANDAFLSLMAHELRSPLTSVKGYAQLLMRQARRHALPETVMRSTESIEQQAARISEMIDELHDAARIRRNRLELLLSPVDLVPIVRQQVERWAKLTPEHTFSLEIEDEALIGEWDPHRVTQIVRDLLDNATRFSPTGGPVEVRLGRAGDEALLAVRDHGIGIPPEDRERIYEYLYRVPAAERRNLSGLGLGLFVSGVIAQRLGGRLWLEWSHTGEPGEDGGSEFRLALPLAPPEELA